MQYLCRILRGHDSKQHYHMSFFRVKQRKYETSARRLILGLAFCEWTRFFVFSDFIALKQQRPKMI